MSSKGKIFDVAVPGIIMINILVFFVWNFVPGGAAFAEKHFVVSREAIGDSRFWTLFTSIFAHHDLGHLIIVCLCLIVFGFLVEDLLGSKWFFECYVMGGFIGGLNHCMIAPLLGHPEAQVYGGLAAMTGIMVLGAFIFSHRVITVLGFLPIRPVWGATLLIGFDLFGISASNAFVGMPVGHGASLGAAIVSILFYHYILRFRIWRNLKSLGDPDAIPITVMGKQGWVIPCRDAEEFENAKAFFGTTMGLKIKQESSHGDIKKSQFSRSIIFKMRSGPLEIVEVNRSLQQVYRSPIPSVTVNNLDQALATLELKKFQFVSPLFRPKKRWAVTYFMGPNDQIYQLQGPYSE